MTKIIFCLLVLLNLYNCEKIDGIRVFEMDKKTSNSNEISVRMGEEFAIKFYSNPSTGYSWQFLNKDENNESIKFIRSKFVDPPSAGPIHIVGRGGYMYYYFKALKVTNGAKVLNFSYNRHWIKKSNNIVTNFVKINVY